jgi:PPM family protein phosphatase
VIDVASATASSRKSGEDRIGVYARSDARVVVVADGAGGRRGGADAADAFVAVVKAAVDDADFDMRDLRRWGRIFEETDVELARRMIGETTGTLVVVSPHGVFGVSAGDSEAWIIDDDRIDDLTADQERRRLGSGRALPSAFSRPTFDGVLVVATDGLFKYADANDIVRGVREAASPSDVADRLMSLVRLPSGGYHDDVAIVVARSRRHP